MKSNRRNALKAAQAMELLRAAKALKDAADKPIEQVDLGALLDGAEKLFDQLAAMEAQNPPAKVPGLQATTRRPGDPVH